MTAERTSRLVLLHPAVAGGIRDFVGTLGAASGAIGPTRLELSELGEQANQQLRIGDSPLIQYSGYGYARRGAPLWIVDQMKQWREAGLTMGVMFHELYAFGPPWTSAFWMSPLQRYVAKRMAELCHYWVTNREESARWLMRFAPAKPHCVLAVFSNVGEEAAYSSKRATKLVVFGSAALRERAYAKGGHALLTWAARQGLEVHDVGAPLQGLTAAGLREAGVACHGHVPAPEVHRILTDAMFGVIDYPIEYIAKSSVFAAYCAHGVCPVVLGDPVGETDGLIPGRHYRPGIPDGIVGPEQAASIGLTAWEWYQSHSVRAHLRALEGVLTEVGIRTSHVS